MNIYTHTNTHIFTYMYLDTYIYTGWHQSQFTKGAIVVDYLSPTCSPSYHMNESRHTYKEAMTHTYVHLISHECKVAYNESSVR